MDVKNTLEVVGLVLAFLGSAGFIAVKTNLIELKLWKKDLKKSNAKINEETIISDDNSYGVLSARISILTLNVLELQEKQIEYNKQIIELNHERAKYQKAFIQIIESCEQLCTEEKTTQCKTVIQKILDQLKINLDDVCKT